MFEILQSPIRSNANHRIGLAIYRRLPRFHPATTPKIRHFPGFFPPYALSLRLMACDGRSHARWQKRHLATQTRRFQTAQNGIPRATQRRSRPIGSTSLRNRSRYHHRFTCPTSQSRTSICLGSRFLDESQRFKKKDIRRSRRFLARRLFQSAIAISRSPHR